MTTYSADNNASKVVSAAEALIKAAWNHVEATSLSLGKETVECLNQLSNEIKDLKGQMVKMNDEILKTQRLEWAITNSDLGSFKYYDKDDYNPQDSSDFVKDILLAFRRGIGHYINDRSVDPYYVRDNDAEAGEYNFREKLKKQIHELIGKEPLIVEEEDGYLIYYS